MYGWAGKVLRVNLSEKRFHIEETETAVLKKFIGGRGINSYFLYKGVRKKIDAFDPENLLIFGTGPLAGTIMPASCRFTVTALSSTTGGHGDANSGGFFASELKFCGFDHIVFEGRSDKPVYLKIDKEGIAIEDAGELWGLDSWQAQSYLRKKYNGREYQIACIGIAGENMARVASVMHGLKRAAAKGMGAVMGSKNLKAVVLKGFRPLEVANPEGFKARAIEIIKSHIRGDMTLYGTTGGVIPEVTSGYSPASKNLQTTVFKGIKDIDPRIMHKKFITKVKACYGCSIGCGRLYEVKEGEFSGLDGEGPELAAIWSWGTQPQVSSIPAVLKADELSNRMGVDCIETGNTIAFAMELYQKGILTKEDTDGLELEWGNYKTVHTLIGKIARREGIGDVLSEGVERASEKIGRSSQYYAHTIKGQSVSSDMRVKHGIVLGYATSTRGADHLRGLVIDDVMPIEYIKKNYGEEALKSKGIKGKGEAVKWVQDMTTVPDCLGACKIFYILSAGYQVFGFKDFAEILSLSTGENFSADDVRSASERIYNIERMFSARTAGFRRKDDRVPELFFREPTDGGSSKGQKLDHNNFQLMLDEYYDARGWDKESGIPLPEKLKSIGLENIAEDAKLL